MDNFAGFPKRHPTVRLKGNDAGAVRTFLILLRATLSQYVTSEGVSADQLVSDLPLPQADDFRRVVAAKRAIGDQRMGQIPEERRAAHARQVEERARAIAEHALAAARAVQEGEPEPVADIPVVNDARKTLNEELYHVLLQVIEGPAQRVVITFIQSVGEEARDGLGLILALMKRYFASSDPR